MQAFIVRPFGTKKDIDFDRVERELIDPALSALGLKGRTTAETLSQGSIRAEMFHRLLTADIVVADVSIHNANVFYELGIRHALRGKATFLIRCASTDLPPDEVPFDLRTDRYLAYDPGAPGATLEKLTEGLRQTLAAAGADSPVFQLLPALKEQDIAAFLPVPTNFREEVERAAASKRTHDLTALAQQAAGAPWEIEGWRLVGRKQFEIKDMEGGRSTLERLRAQKPDDLETNTLLATVFQRLSDLTRSDQAIARVLALPHVAGYDRAEILALRGRNAKARWLSEWTAVLPERQRTKALRSGFLGDAMTAYGEGFNQDLNHFFSGLNALALRVVERELAVALPDVWASRFEDGAAMAVLEDRRKRIQALEASVRQSLEAAEERLRRAQTTDVFTEISKADLCLLTSGNPQRVEAAYEEALSGAPDFARSSARGQIELYQRLGILSANVAAALEVFGPA